MTTNGVMTADARYLCGSLPELLVPFQLRLWPVTRWSQTSSSPCSARHCIASSLQYMKLYSPNHGNSKDRETDIYKESKHEICYSKVLTRCLTTTF